jgi:hypothetical protein
MKNGNIVSEAEQIELRIETMVFNKNINFEVVSYITNQFLIIKKNILNKSSK